MSNSDGRDGDIDARFDDIMSHWDEVGIEPGQDQDEAGHPSSKAVNPAPHLRGAPGPVPDAGQEPPGEVDDRAALSDRGDRGAEDDQGDRGDQGAGSEEPREEVAATGDEPTAAGWRTHTPPEEEEHFVPPPPAPLPAGDLQFWGILLGLVGGPGLLLYLIMFDRDAGSLWIALGIALSVGGFGLLVARLPSHRDEDDDDDGAVV